MRLTKLHLPQHAGLLQMTLSKQRSVQVAREGFGVPIVRIMIYQGPYPQFQDTFLWVKRLPGLRMIRTVSGMSYYIGDHYEGY